MSTSVSQVNSTSSWKQEVNRRIAAHQSRGALSTTKPSAPAQKRSAAGSRYAQAAARVAARYAHAPSYSQMQMAEAHTAQPDLPVQQAASARPRLQESELPQAVTSPQPPEQHYTPSIEPAVPVAPSSLHAVKSEFSNIGQEPDFAARPAVTAPVRALPPVEGFASRAEEDWERQAVEEEPWNGDDIEPVEPDQPIHANLIEFPRELVATRKRRPQRAEGPFAAAGAQRQLSIFEVDPAAISTQPDAAGATPAWPNPEWSSIELEAQPADEPETHDAPPSQLVPQRARLGGRLAAALVDGALIASALAGAVMVAASNIGHPLPAKIVEFSALSAFLLACLLYQMLFLALAVATPGMKSAGISLCTFDGQSLTRAQSRHRLGALLLSVLPLGLGIVWALFDDDHLCWHDRLSKTYLRKR